MSFSRLEKPLALLISTALVGAIVYFYLGRNIPITLGVCVGYGTLSYMEVMKETPEEMAGGFSFELFLGNVFRGFFAVIFLIISAISS